MTAIRNNHTARIIVIIVLVILASVLLSSCNAGFMPGPFSAQPDQIPAVNMEGVSMFCQVLGFCQ